MADRVRDDKLEVVGGGRTALSSSTSVGDTEPAGAREDEAEDPKWPPKESSTRGR